MSGAVEGVARAKAMLLGDEDTQGIRPQVTFADHSYPAYSKQQMIDFALLYAASRTTPPARSYADGEAVDLLQRWEAACEQHNALLASGEDVTGAKVKRSGSKCTSLYSQLTTASIAAIRLLSQGGKA